MDAFIALDGEHFRIRQANDGDATAYKALPPSKRSLQRIARDVRPTKAPAGEEPSSVEIAVARSNESNKTEPGWYVSKIDEEEPLDGDRFEI